jgi:hypothetical protein
MPVIDLVDGFWFWLVGFGAVDELYKMLPCSFLKTLTLGGDPHSYFFFIFFYQNNMVMKIDPRLGRLEKIHTC